MDIASQLLLANKPLSSGSTDPYWSNVVLYLKGDGANGSTNIVDSSSNPKTITVNGNTQISTAQSKYGGSSIFFDGVNSYIRCDSALYDINSVSTLFTIELWIYPLSISSNEYFVGINKFTNGGNILVCGTYATDVNKIAIYYEQSTIFGFSNITVNQWNHVAICYDSNSLRLYKNGVITITLTSYSFLTALSLCSLIIGAEADSGDGGSLGNWFHCYIDNFRITKNTARYTSNFNPETDTFMS